MVGVLGGMSSYTRIRANSSAILVVTLFVPYTADRSCTCESISIVDRCIQFLDGFELLIAVMVILTAAYAFFGVDVGVMDICVRSVMV